MELSGATPGRVSKAGDGSPAFDNGALQCTIIPVNT